MRRARICQLITGLGPGGAERCVYELATRLDRRRFDVQVAALRGGAVADRLAVAGVAVHVVGARRWADAWKLPHLAGHLRRARLDLLHTHLFHADLAGRPAARAAGVGRLVHTVHTAEGRWRPWQFAWARAAAGWCDRIVCVGRAVRRFHARRSGLPAWRYVVIPNAVDTPRWAPDAGARARRRRRWGIADDEVLLAFVGLLAREKGIDTLLEAFGLLVARGARVRLVIAGDGPMRRRVAAFIAGRPGGERVRWLGFADDVPAVLRAADLCVAPSRWEGLPLAVIEAMAAGLPVVASRTAGLAELVLDGRTGRLVDAEDAAGLAGAIEALAADRPLRRRMGDAARRRAEANYDLAANVAAHERLYEDVLARRPAEGPGEFLKQVNRPVR
jgi:glycosyltransferase involved in cell wall biosynthesis